MAINGVCGQGPGDVTSLWGRVKRLDAYQITEIPRRDDGGSGESPRRGDEGRPQRVAALAAAYHATVSGLADGERPDRPGLVAFGWIRLAAGGRVHLVAAGDALVGSGGSGSTQGDVMLALPGGARARALRPGLAGLLEKLPCWRAIGGISDGLLTGEEDTGTSRQPSPPSLDECLLASWTCPFGWLIVAEPVRPAELRALADEAASRQHLAEGMADRLPERAVGARRLRARHEELRRGLSTGLWRLRVLAGGADSMAAARIAGLYCASADLDGLPYVLAPAAAPAASAGEVLDGACPEPDPGPGGDAAVSASFYASTVLVAALARAPEAEVPGVRLALRPDFDVTPENAAGTARAGITLGEVLDRNLAPAGELRIPLESVNRHVFVCGATGAGKSQTVRALLEAAARQNVPWLVIEPAKAEYRLMANRGAGDVVRIRPGEPDAIAAGLNPLESASGFPLQTHADLVRALFIASFRSEEPFPQVLSAALTRVYEEAGWDLALGEPVSETAGAAYPGLSDLQRAAESVVSEIGYSQRITDDVLGFIKVRLASLRAGTTGRFLEGGHQIDFGALLRRNVVLEIEDVGDDRDKAFLMGTVLIRLAEHLRMTHRMRTGDPGAAGALQHLTVFEEAHRLLRRPDAAGGAAAHAVEMFAGLLAEIRAYGEGLIIAEQIPARLTPDAIKNTAVKITHRLPAADDREAVGATMNMTAPQSRYLVTLAPGQAAAFTDGMDHPILVKVQDGTEREVVAPPATLDAVAVVSRRSVTCGAECVARPCTLRDMRAAQRALGRYPGIRLWAELTVLAHLTGWPMPVPKPELLAQIRGLPPRLRECAVSHGVDAAVAVRAPAFAARVDSSALAAHACAAIRARAGRDLWLCQPDEPTWLVPGRATREMTFGVASPSAVEVAVGARAGDGDLAERVTAQLERFVDCRWPLQYLAGPATRSASGAP
jgi:DNA helicase HerA-like ATPase